MNEDREVGIYQDRLWVFLEAGNYKKTAVATNLLLPVRGKHGQIIIGYLLVSVTIGSSNNYISALESDDSLEDEKIERKLILPLDLEQDEACMTVDVLKA